MMSVEGPYSKDRSLYLKFMGDLLEKTLFLEPSLTHYFIYSILSMNSKALWMTMNIDGLEEYFLLNDDPKDSDNCQVMFLHGSLRKALCTSCYRITPVDDQILSLYKSGFTPLCPFCKEMGKRVMGKLEPDILLYGQGASRFAAHFQDRQDTLGQPSIVFVMGTTLGSEDGQAHVKEWGKDPNTLIIYVDRNAHRGAHLEGLFDFHFVMECDVFVKRLADTHGINLQQVSEPVHHHILKQQEQKLTDDIFDIIQDMVLTDEIAFKNCCSYFKAC